MEFELYKSLWNFIKYNNRAPLHLAARLGDASIVEFLLSKNADPNVITVEKDNALHFAAQTGYVDVGTLLIKHNELINAKNSEGVFLNNLTSNSTSYCCCKWIVGLFCFTC